MPEHVSWKEYVGKDPIWCPGCGDFGVLRAMQKAMENLGLAPRDVVLVTGIGCSGTITANFQSHGYHALHGRALPVAAGIKLARPASTVLVAGGDGDGYGIGLGHFLHAARRNLDVTYIVMDNQVYGLTKGQTSPTTAGDMTTKASPLGPMADPLSPLELAIAGGASFVAQGFSGDVKALTALIADGVRHRGFSLINIQSPCVTYNLLNTYDWFREHGRQADHDATDRDAAMAAVRDRAAVPFGLIYQTDRPTWTDHLDREDGGPDAVAAADDAAASLAAARATVSAWVDAFQER